MQRGSETVGAALERPGKELSHGPLIVEIHILFPGQIVQIVRIFTARFICQTADLCGAFQQIVFLLQRLLFAQSRTELFFQQLFG